MILAIAAMAIFGLMLGRLSMGFVDAMSDPVITLNGEQYGMAPSRNQMDKAIALHADMQDAIMDSNYVVVLGGQNENSGSAPATPPPLEEAFTAGNTLETAMGVRNASRTNIQNATDFYDAYSGTLSSFAESTYTNNDFTVLAIRERTIQAVAQCRRTTTNANIGSGNEPVVAYHVRLDTGGDVQNYRFFLRAGEDTWGMQIGAKHYWYRNDTQWDRREQLGTMLVFPDPGILAGKSASSLTNASFSRFTLWENFAQ